MHLVGSQITNLWIETQTRTQGHHNHPISGKSCSATLGHAARTAAPSRIALTEKTAAGLKQGEDG